MFCQKRMRDYQLKPCDQYFLCEHSRIFTADYVIYSMCIDKKQENIEYLAAFDHGVGRKQKGICARFIMGILVDKSMVPASGEVRGWCYKYQTRDQVMADVLARARRKKRLLSKTK